MKVVQVVPSIAEESSGPSYSTVRLTESLLAAGAEVTLAALDWSPMQQPPSFLKTFPLGLGPRRLGRSPAMRKWICRGAESGDFDVIHNNGMWQMNSIYPANASKRGNIPLVCSPRGSFSKWAMSHGSNAKKIFWPLLQYPALKHVSCFHATAESEYDEIRRLGFKQPVLILPNGIDIPNDSQVRTKIDNGKKTILYLGRLHPKKGIDFLLGAWSKLEKNFPDWNVEIVGSDGTYASKPGYGNYLKNLAHELKLTRVEFAGQLKGMEKLRAYQRANLFVLPTHSENFGLVVGEALAMGTPAIVSKGAPWAQLPAVNAGWHIEIGEEPLVNSLRHAMQLPVTELAEMGASGRRWIQRDFAWNTIGEKMLEAYQWLAGLHPRPSNVRID